MENVTYEFSRGRRSILAEIYFPHRVATQGVIFDTLKKGLDIKHVKAYLVRNAGQIMRELDAYPHWFNPERYGANVAVKSPVARAKQRMEMCSQVFYGWSMYEVDGVFLKKDGITIDEERTQVLRLMFRFVDEELEIKAYADGYPEVYRAVQYWVMSEYGHTDNYLVWDERERERFISRHVMWSSEQRKYARLLYEKLTPKLVKWIADCGLIVFGYIVREFWKEIVSLNAIEGGSLEDEIWVTSVFQLNINSMEPVRTS